jgi:chorismate synthase
MSLRFLTAGESHGPAMTVILDGMPAGLALTVEMINHGLARRQQGYGSGGRMKMEQDTIQILGGVMGGETTGAPIALLVSNMDHIHWAGKPNAPMTKPRPGHADLAGAVKYGYKDLRPALERASARETVMRVAVGAICKHFLAQFGIVVGGYVKSIGGIEGDFSGMTFPERFEAAEKSEVRCPDARAAQKMRERIDEIIQARDTLGGVLEITALNVPVGLGSYSQWDKRLEARLAMAVMSIQAMKGVEVGEASENAGLTGTQVQDAIRLEAIKTAGGRLSRPSNRAGGIEGGISNGMPIVIRTAMKPIATTLTPQNTVDLATGQEGLTKYERSDFCPVARAVPIVEAMVAFVLAEALIEKLGGDGLDEMKPRFEALRQARLEDLTMDNSEHIFWEN